MTPEFSRLVDSRHAVGRDLRLEANALERAALADRFGLEAIDSLVAEMSFAREGPAILAEGRLESEVTQRCAVSGEPLRTRVHEPVRLRFIPAAAAPELGEEVELAPGDLDEIAYEGISFDLGEAIAQSLALAIDPFAVGPEADRVRREAGLLDESAAGPFAALATLKDKREG